MNEDELRNLRIRLSTHPYTVTPSKYFGLVKPDYVCVRCGAKLPGADVVCDAPECMDWSRRLLSDEDGDEA